MEVSISLLPICHCQVSPTVGRHQDEIGCELELADRVEDIRVEVAFETDQFEVRARRVYIQRRKSLRKSLNHMMFELRQIILVLCKEFVGHLADLGERQHSRGKWVMCNGAIDHGRVTCYRGCDGHLFDAAG